jgi:hypothetical protein
MAVQIAAINPGRPVGRDAAARKYDILSALSVMALAGDPHGQRQALRLMALITTRYNWQRDELSMGQEEMAALWSVDERTVKREMARLRAKGWVTVKRAGARGRVGLYGVDVVRILDDARPQWSVLGPDFIARVAPGAGSPAPSNVIPLDVARKPVPPGDAVWDMARRLLQEEDAAVYGAWLHRLEEVGVGQGVLTLAAPSRFHASYVATHLRARLVAAVARVDPSVRDVRVEA